MKSNGVVSFFAISAILFLQASSSLNKRGIIQSQVQITATPSSNITISGTVKGENGQPLRTYISITSGMYEALGNVMSDKGGKYAIQVPYRKGYIVNAQEADGRVMFGPDVIPTGYLDQDKTVMSDSLKDLVVDFNMQPAGAIWLKTYDLNGNYLFRQDVNNNNWRVAIYPLGQPPTSRPLQYINHQANTFWGWQNGNDKNHTVLLIPPDKPVELWIDYHVPEIGDTYIHLDNDGQGYAVKKGDVLQVNFLFDAAKTEYRLYNQRIAQYISDGYTFSEDITGWNDEAGQILEAMTNDCVAKNFGPCISTANTVLTRTLRSREDSILQVAQQDIEKYRKQDVKLQLTHCDGTPANAVGVVYEQQTHDFILGVGWPENKQLATLKETGINGAIQEAWWGEVISDNGAYDYHDERFDPITQQGLDIVMHTGVWITPITNPNWNFVPRMIFNMSPAEIANLARDYSAKVTEHYRDNMSIYDVYNEPQNAFFTKHFTLDDVVNIAAASAEGASQGAPNVPTYINFYYAYLGGDMSWVANPYNENYPPPEEILKAIIQKDVPFDNIGLEFYNDPSIDFGIYNDTIEHFSHFGKSILISELSYNGNWRDGRTDQTPAEWAKYAYTIAFSKPYVTGVVWIPGNNPSSPGYLFNSNGEPRPLLDAIGSVIHSWTTSGNGNTNELGELAFRGFSGQYKIRWQDPAGSEQISTIQVSRDTQNNFLLKPSSCQIPAPSTATSAKASPSPISNVQKEVGNQFPLVGIGVFVIVLLLAIGRFIWRHGAKK
ncbi:MAG: endo-1,4-beta-xylanase [Anaerolineales bacterium]|nr:endo-1,4-beta-xylanase [Anaerolineales bacterium]